MGLLTLSRAVLVTSPLLLYLFLVRILRYRRRDDLQRKFGYTTRESLGKMSMDDAAAIHKELSEMEFPFIIMTSMEFALFRTYGIPTVSSLLVSTREITNPENVAKRLSDTAAIMFEIEGSVPSSTRWQNAVARLNFIHGVYQKAGKISNDDLLYTLSLFAGEPPKWVSRYEWRDLTMMETAAIGTFWKGVGEAMNIDYSVLPSYSEGWQDGIHWREEVTQWAQTYEEKHMVPHDDNHDLALSTLEYILWPVPKMLLPSGLKLFQTLMDDRLRFAMKLEKPSPSWFNFTTNALAIRKFMIRHFTFPRPEIWRMSYKDDKPNKYGKYNLRIYSGPPVYVEPTFSWRWNIQAWLYWSLGRAIPGDDGDRYFPQGYDIATVGPDKLADKGAHESAVFLERISQLPRCPFRP